MPLSDSITGVRRTGNDVAFTRILKAQGRMRAAFIRTMLGYSGPLVILLLVGFAVLYGTMVMTLRTEAWNRAIVSSDNLLRSLDGNLARSLGEYHDTFEILATELGTAEHNKLAGGHESVAVRAHGALIKSTGDLFLFDETGTIQERSHNLLAREALKHRDFLEIHRRDPSLAVRIGAPFRDRASGNTVLWISRRLNRPDGRFAGVLAGTLDTGRWRQAFESYSIGPKSSINLFHADGTLMMRAPFVADRIGSNLAGTNNFKRFAAEPSGTFVGKSAIDGEERAYHFVRIDDTPLILNVATSTAEIYAGWWRGTLVSGVVVAILAGLAVMLRLVLSRELRLRLASEARYRALSDVDGLTGVANRRRFDEVLVLEWANAAASGRPVSVIMLDVDHFKLFNDRYGHQAGDACLRTVAAALRKAVGRSEDLVARYGGEEFVVLLPGTDATGSAVVAERIRAAVQESAISHAGNPEAGVVTVSLGTSTADPSRDRGTVPSLLVSCADQALYRAKRAGRNRGEHQPCLSTETDVPVREDENARLAIVERRRSHLPVRSSANFDELARIAATALEASVAFVSLVGSERQAFIGKAGSDAEGIPREQSFCAHAIAGNGVLVVADAGTDPRFSDNPLVTGPMGVRFYAGAPVVDPQTGHGLGAVCVVDTAPRAGLTPFQERLLTSLADVAAQRLVSRSGPILPADTRKANTSSVTPAAMQERHG
ncbi:diguanylate cyclase [Aureimonas sp. Leaf324]|jgi:diguanylate cyclase (GGDEF)-like protein|uniref:diguanylate cyclase n=1 Tax=Aureimonas sp. Leaf324 TaxID=1736336 RepID=UPI000AC774A3|nr:diguanylate cyclase [Aureimonas sp. Leaf324]